MGFVDGDAEPDFAIGANGSASSRGRIYVIAGQPATVSYCTAGTTSNGCRPAISGSGTPSGSAGTGFDVAVDLMDARKNGMRAVGWSPPRVGDFHVPARFGKVTFAADPDAKVPAVELSKAPASPKSAAPAAPVTPKAKKGESAKSQTN